MVDPEPLDGELALASHWVVMDSFLEFLGPFPLGLLVFAALALVVIFSASAVGIWIVSKITGKTFGEASKMFDGKGHDAAVMATDLTVHLGGTASTANQLTRSASPARHPRPVPRLAGEGR